MCYIKKYDLCFRFVEIDDASFILSLRTNPKLNQHISHTINDLELQKEWIRKYKEREANKKEFYFICQDENKSVYGLIRIYNIDRNSFEVGSWLFAENSPEGMSIKADILCKEIGFEKLNLDYCRFEVRKKNKKADQYYSLYKPSLVREDQDNNYYLLTRESFYDEKNKLLHLLQHGTFA